MLHFGRNQVAESRSPKTFALISRLEWSALRTMHNTENQYQCRHHPLTERDVDCRQLGTLSIEATDRIDDESHTTINSL